jgi:hypothetical protein
MLKGLSIALAVLSSIFNISLAIAEIASPARKAPSDSFFVEFRAASIGLYGHSYVAYGRIERGRPTQVRYADLHPTGNYGMMALGHMVPVPANTEWNPEVLKLPVASSYRRQITAKQFAALEARVKNSRREQRYWNALTYNCNHYVAELARAAGLKAPTDLQVSYAFVPALRALNE